jgi:hypothetical protein
MSGYETYTRLQRIEAQAKHLGFRLGNPKHGYTGRGDVEFVAVFPAEDQLPIYSRDAELFVGSFRELEVWLNGWAKAQQYDYMLRLTDEEKRKKFEDKERERQRLEAERLEKRKMFAALSDKTEDQVNKLIK